VGKIIIDQLFEDAGGDPLELTVSEREKPKPKPKPKKAWKRHYTRMPEAWKLRLLGSGGSTYRLAIELLYLHWQNGGQPVVVSNKVAKAVKLSARAKGIALANLKRLGLIRVKQEPGKAPRVTLLRILIP
jgi:hypothetical protein